MLSQSAATNLSGDILKKQLYASVGLPYDDDFMLFLDKNFSPYNFIIGCNPFIRNAKSGQIGNLRNICIFQYSQSNILNELCLDLNDLHYEYRILDTRFSDRSLRKREFMLKIFICDPSEACRRGDYKIMRFDKEIGEWFFKPSTFEAPILCKDAAGVIIISDEPVGYVERVDKTVTKEFYPFAYVAVRQLSLSKKIWKAFRLLIRWAKRRYEVHEK